MTSAQENFRKLYDAYHERIYFFALKRLADKGLAEDIVQNTFLKIWENKSYIVDDKATEALVFKIARNLVIDNYRRKVLQTEAITSKNSTVPSRDQDVLTALEEREKVDLVNATIRELPEMRRKVFEMSRKDGLTYKEIASELSISSKTVENHISSSLKFLRQRLAKILFMAF